jgi:hypothetical protein
MWLLVLHRPPAEVDPEYIFTFPDPGTAGVSPPILGFHDVDFNYLGGPTLFKNLNFGMVGDGDGGWMDSSEL